MRYAVDVVIIPTFEELQTMLTELAKEFKNSIRLNFTKTRSRCNTR